MSKARQLADLGNVYDDGALSNRNLIINGAMQVAQRGTSFTSASGYTIDRFDLSFDVGAVTVTQNAVTDLAGFGKSFKVQCTTTATSTGTNHNWFQYLIEGQDCQRFGFGTSGANELTLSFYAKSNNTDTRVVWFYNPSSARMYAQTFSNSTADTWERIVVSIPADTAGSIANNTNSGFYVRFVLAAGPDYKGGIPSSGWVGASNNRYQGVSDFLDSTSNYFEITGVQLEVGDTATPFEHRSYGDELARCQRYFYSSYKTGDAIGSTSNANGAVALRNGSTDNAIFTVNLPTELRVSGTLTTYSTITGVSGKIRNRNDNTDVTGARLNSGTKNVAFYGGSSSDENDWMDAQITVDAEL